MNVEGASELQRFQQFLVEVAGRRGAPTSPEDALDEWRASHPSDDDLLAVQQALDDMHAGDVGTPLEEFDKQMRLKHNLPERS
jgi:hypothetical protein